MTALLTSPTPAPPRLPLRWALTDAATLVGRCVRLTRRDADSLVMAIVRDLVAGGVTVFLTTQYLEEADRLADRVALLDRGRLVAEGTPAELKRAGGHASLDELFLALTEETR